MAGFSDETQQAAMRRLKRSDKRMGAVIKKVGAPQIRHSRGRFSTLVRSILSQQISGAAARTIQGRLKDRIGAFTAPAICQLSVDELRALGVSNQKAGYLLDLAERANSGQLRFTRHTRMDDEAVIEDLIQVKGIGRWTAQMYLIFSLSRSDVFPEDDLGVRKGMQNIYDLESSDNLEELRAIAADWRPYCSIASWYCWRSLETD